MLIVLPSLLLLPNDKYGQTLKCCGHTHLQTMDNVQQTYFVGSEVSTVVIMKNAKFWDVAPHPRRWHSSNTLIL
jgi:hypothetical protein